MPSQSSGLLLAALLGLALAAPAQVPAASTTPQPQLAALVSRASLPRASVPGVAAPTGRAVVFGVRNAGKLVRFVIPQVRLANAPVAARINRQLVWGFAQDMETPPKPLTARAAVRQAQAECLALDGRGFTSAGYTVRYNSHSLLSIELEMEYEGAYPSTAIRHVTFDLRTGRPVTIGQLVADTLALRRRWRQKMTERVAESTSDLATDFPEMDSSGVEDLHQRFGWNPVQKRVAFEPGEPRFDDFSLTATGLVLYHDFGFPHAMLALQPATDFVFPYASIRKWLSPVGPLRFRK